MLKKDTNIISSLVKELLLELLRDKIRATEDTKDSSISYSSIEYSIYSDLDYSRGFICDFSPYRISRNQFLRVDIVTDDYNRTVEEFLEEFKQNRKLSLAKSVYKAKTTQACIKTLFKIFLNKDLVNRSEIVGLFKNSELEISRLEYLIRKYFTGLSKFHRVSYLRNSVTIPAKFSIEKKYKDYVFRIDFISETNPDYLASSVIYFEIFRKKQTEKEKEKEKIEEDYPIFSLSFDVSPIAELFNFFLSSRTDKKLRASQFVIKSRQGLEEREREELSQVSDEIFRELMNDKEKEISEFLNSVFVDKLVDYNTILEGLDNLSKAKSLIHSL